MARYIDADKVIEKIVNTPSMLPYEYDFDEKVLSLLAQRQNEILDIVEMNVPTENVAPVIHAHWIEDCGDYKCSHCSTEFWDEMVFIVRTSEHEFPNYCPVCGAKMDEVVEDA